MVASGAADARIWHKTKGIDSWALETDLGYTKMLDGPTHIGKPEPVRHSDEETLGRLHWILLVLGLGSERIAWPDLESDQLRNWI